jgi:putative endopeptidase
MIKRIVLCGTACSAIAAVAAPALSAGRHDAHPATARQRIATDPHMPGHYRPFVGPIFDAWYKAFDVRDGKLYLGPEQRIRIW